MKIKKTYTHARVGLLVGLLSFHTLYSCVHTGRELGMGLSQSKQAKARKIEEAKYKEQCPPCIISSNNNSDSSFKYSDSKQFVCPRIVKVGVGVGVVGGMVVGYLVYNNMLYPATPIENTLTNAMLPGGNATTALASNLVPVQSMVNTTIGAIGSTVKDVVTTAGTVGIVALNTTGIIAALKPNGSNVHDNSSKVTTTTPITPTDRDIPTKPTPVPFNIKPIPLTREVISDIRAHEFSISRLKYWHKQGLPIDAPDLEERRTLLIEATNLNLLAQVKWLRLNGANLNATDDRGNTALMYAIHNANKAEGKAKTEAKVIIDYLLKHGATPCTKNVDGRPFNTDIKPLNNKGLLDAFEKC